jgi:hypothetical protein
MVEKNSSTSSMWEEDFKVLSVVEAFNLKVETGHTVGGVEIIFFIRAKE